MFTLMLYDTYSEHYIQSVTVKQVKSWLIRLKAPPQLHYLAVVVSLISFTEGSTLYSLRHEIR